MSFVAPALVALLLLPPLETLDGKNSAYRLRPAETVCGGVVSLYDWNGDSKRLAAVRTLEPPRMGNDWELVVWNAASRSSAVIARGKMADLPTQLGWLADGSLVSVAGGEQSSVWLYRSSGARLLHKFDAPVNIWPDLSKSQVALAWSKGAQSAVSFVTAGGLTPPVEMPPLSYVSGWTNDRQTLVASVRNGGKPIYYGLKPTGTAWAKRDTPPVTDYSNPQVSGELRLYERNGELKRIDLSTAEEVLGLMEPMTGQEAKLAPIPPNSQAPLTGDGGQSSLSPDGTWAAYVTHGALLVRPIERISLQVSQEERNAHAKAQALEDAKYAALGLIMFAADMDDVLPSNAAGWQDKIMPYVRDKRVLNRFQLSFRGGDLTKVEKPAETILGYVDAPGGRAVAYLDGHVKWHPKP